MMQPNDGNVMLYMGNDFTFDNAFYAYRQLDMLIEYCNQYQTVNLTCIYSTPGQYIDAVKKENIEWPVKDSGDFFPYEERSKNEPVDVEGVTPKPIGDGSWTGYFTSRPNFKKQIRDASSSFHAHTKLFA